MPDTPTRAQLETAVGSTLVAATGQGDVPLTLTELVDHGATAETETFSAYFTGPLAPELPQGTYTLAAADGETFDIFIVPIARDADGMRYEAVFNLLVGTAGE